MSRDQSHYHLIIINYKMIDYYLIIITYLCGCDFVSHLNYAAFIGPHVALYDNVQIIAAFSGICECRFGKCRQMWGRLEIFDVFSAIQFIAHCLGDDDLDPWPQSILLRGISPR